MTWVYGNLSISLVAAATVRSVFGPFVEIVKSLDLPEWLVHWGHPGNMVLLLLRRFLLLIYHFHVSLTFASCARFHNQCVWKPFPLDVETRVLVPQMKLFSFCSWTFIYNCLWWSSVFSQAVVLFAMGGYGTYLGFRIRYSDDIVRLFNQTVWL